MVNRVRFERARWWGLAAGLAGGLFDRWAMGALGVSFQMNGREAGWLVTVVVGSGYGMLGFLIGLLVEARRRDRRAAETIRAQSEAIAATRARLVQTEKLAALGQLA